MSSFSKQVKLVFLFIVLCASGLLFYLNFSTAPSIKLQSDSQYLEVTLNDRDFVVNKLGDWGVVKGGDVVVAGVNPSGNVTSSILLLTELRRGLRPQPGYYYSISSTIKPSISTSETAHRTPSNRG
jgi:hypothetical protein